MDSKVYEQSRRHYEHYDHLSSDCFYTFIPVNDFVHDIQVKRKEVNYVR